MTPYRILLATVPSKQEGEKIVRHLLEKKLIACGNLVPGVESHYWWNEKIETSQEVLLILKTDEIHSQEAQKTLIELHSYEVPEVLVLPVSDGNESYLKWVTDSLKKG